MKYLLDTCVVSESARAGASPAVLAWLNARDEADVAISSLTLGEIEFGIGRLPASRRRARFASSLEALEARFAERTLSVDGRVSRAWGEIRARAAERGATVPLVDALIAATAIVHHLILVTRNIDDVRATGVRVINPWTTSGA